MSYRPSFTECFPTSRVSNTCKIMSTRRVARLETAMVHVLLVIIITTTFLQRKRKTESPPDSGEGAVCHSDPSSSSSPEISIPDGSSHDDVRSADHASDLPAEKRPKLDTTATTSEAASSSESKLVNGSSKLVGKSSKLSSRLSSSKMVNGHGGGSSSTSSTLRAGSSASVVVKKATKELDATFKSATKDPNARDAYKALFHSKDKERPKEKSAHWVTFFPYH